MLVTFGELCQICQWPVPELLAESCRARPRIRISNYSFSFSRAVSRRYRYHYQTPGDPQTHHRCQSCPWQVASPLDVLARGCRFETRTTAAMRNNAYLEI